MNLRLQALVERLRSSLFFVPMLAVVVGAVGGLASLAVDRNVDTTLADLPFGFTSTVESARTLLGVIAGATISFAGIAFSVALLIIQLASSQFSPRVVHTLFRDPYNKRVMAVVVGTFTYCVVVLRSVRSALDDGGEAVIPNISVAVAVALGIATILSIVAFINHSAHAMDISEVLERIRRETIAQIRAEWAVAEKGAGVFSPLLPPASEPCTVVRSDRSGWVQQIDAAALLECLPTGTTAHVRTYAGRYVIEHTTLVTLAPPVADDAVEAAVHAAFAIGATRTMQQDVTYGLRQLVDVAVKALSPGINDPTTAQDAIFHVSAVLAELLLHDPPQPVVGDRSRRLVLVEQPTHPDLVAVAFDEIRRAGALQPTVCRYVLDALESLVDAVEGAGLGERAEDLRRQANLAVLGCGRSDLLAEDVDAVRLAHRRRAARLTTPAGSNPPATR